MLLLIVVLATFGVQWARKALRARLVGPPDVYVVLEVEGRTLVYKNPDRPFHPVDEPIADVPPEIFDPEKFDVCYNVCWFDDHGTLRRCDHPYHRTAEQASYCRLNGVRHTLIGKILEHR